MKNYKVSDNQTFYYLLFGLFRDGSGNARNVVLRRLDKDGFVVTTNRNSEKATEIADNPNCGATFLWVYMKGSSRITRQVSTLCFSFLIALHIHLSTRINNCSAQARLKCRARELPSEESRGIYEKEPLFCKIRAHICEQGKPVVWEELKELHDKVFTESQEGKHELNMPDN